MTIANSEPVASTTKKHSTTLIFAAFISGLCSIIYELLIATTASYFLGDSVKYFSLTIGIYMASMGVGTLLSKYIDKDIMFRFIQIELVLALTGGLSIPILYFAYAYTGLFIPVYLALTILIGVLIGLEIPFLTRLMDHYCQLKINIANILSFDYFGALIATLAFPFLLLPFFGVYQSSLLFGLANMSIGFTMLWVFGEQMGARKRVLQRLSILLLFILAGMLALSGYFLHHWDQNLYEDRIIHSEQTLYQRMILTKERDDIRLYLDGNLQFSSIDEYRYHEALIHIPMSLVAQPVKRVLVLGAGDGLAIRELLKYQEIEEIVLVELDPRMIELAKTNSYLTALNQQSLSSPKISVVIADAMAYVSQPNTEFDLIVADLPDPNNHALTRLYSRQFYQLIKSSLNPNGLFITQATSPYFAPKAFWSIAKTIQAATFGTIYPYHANIPSFGEWGFILASDVKLPLAKPELRVETRYLDLSTFSHFFTFDKDTVATDVEVNELDKPILLDYYLRGWEYYR